MKRLLLLLLALTSLCAMAQPQGGTIRICDNTGCSDRPRNSSTFDPATGADRDAERRITELEAIAAKDPRAAYDLGLRFFRGDGVRQDSYSALKWMRDAAERGELSAQLAVGRFYLMGLEEMGSDPAEAEKWLSMAAGRGDIEAKKLLVQAQSAKADARTYYAWREANRNTWYGWWHSGYNYYTYWGPTGWYYR
jgi:uncharacterized protein